jgi:hypothetical protein
MARFGRWNEVCTFALGLESGDGARRSAKVQVMLGTILLIILILVLVGALPTWGYSRGWGYAPSGILGIVVIVLIIMLLTGRLGPTERARASWPAASLRQAFIVSPSEHLGAAPTGSDIDKNGNAPAGDPAGALQFEETGRQFVVVGSGAGGVVGASVVGASVFGASIVTPTLSPPTLPLSLMRK